jgi:hypothetical protein
LGYLLGQSLYEELSSLSIVQERKTEIDSVSVELEFVVTIKVCDRERT